MGICNQRWNINWHSWQFLLIEIFSSFFFGFSFVRALNKTVKMMVAAHMLCLDMASLSRRRISSLTKQETSYYCRKETDRGANHPLTCRLWFSACKPKTTLWMNLVLFLSIILMSRFINHTLRWPNPSLSKFYLLRADGRLEQASWFQRCDISTALWSPMKWPWSISSSASKPVTQTTDGWQQWWMWRGIAFSPL